MPTLAQTIFPTMMTRRGYSQLVKGVFGSSLIAYWPLNEASGTVVYDISGNGFNGTYNGPTLAQSAPPMGGKAPSWDGNNDICDVSSTDFAAAFNGAEGTISAWFKVSAGAVWSDGVFRRIFAVNFGTNDYFRLMRDQYANNLAFQRDASATNSYVYITYISSTGWMHVAATWSVSNDRIRTYVNGKQFDGATGLGTFAGTFANATIGYRPSVAVTWSGNIAHVAVGNTELTPSQIAQLAYPQSIKKMTVLGDSIENFAGGWPIWTAHASPGGNRTTLTNRAVNSKYIMDGMDAQVVAAASDDADIIIIALGTGDNNGGNMTTLQAEAEENIAELKASNPHATIYWMNVLPRWTDNTTGAEVDKSNIRTAIAAACTAQGITCWDTYTTPWIAQNQTSDGEHPTAAGHAAILAQVLARL